MKYHFGEISFVILCLFPLCFISNESTPLIRPTFWKHSPPTVTPSDPPISEPGVCPGFSPPCLPPPCSWCSALHCYPQQEYWSELPCPPPGDLLDPGIEPESLTSPALAGRLFITTATWEALKTRVSAYIYEKIVKEVRKWLRLKLRYWCLANQRKPSVV